MDCGYLTCKALNIDQDALPRQILWQFDYPLARSAKYRVERCPRAGVRPNRIHNLAPYLYSNGGMPRIRVQPAHSPLQSQGHEPVQRLYHNRMGKLFPQVHDPCLVP